MRRLPLVLVVALAPQLAGAQSLRGAVVDTAGRPVRFATVRLLSDTTFTTAALAQASTDTSGRFGFETVPPGARYLRTFRLGFLPTLMALGELRGPADTVLVTMGKRERERARQDSLRAIRHRERVALAHARPRRWRCTLGDSIARVRATAAYRSFVATPYEGMRRVTVDRGMASDSAGFMRRFLQPLSRDECARFASGLDASSSGLESDTVEVYHFGRAFYLPWMGGYEGGFADADGKIVLVFIVPD